jgi:hypothetical protein
MCEILDVDATAPEGVLLSNSRATNVVMMIVFPFGHFDGKEQAWGSWCWHIGKDSPKSPTLAMPAVVVNILRVMLWVSFLRYGFG